MADRQIPVILKFLLDKGTLEGIKSGTMSIEQGFYKLENTLIRNQNALIDIGKSMKQVEAQSKRMFVGSVAFISGIVAFSNNYIKNLDETNTLTRKWESNSKRVQEAQQRIGKITAQEVLPLYEKAAGIVEDIAGFVESNPQIVKAALNTGLFVAGFSALVIATSKGIKFVADVSYIATVTTQFLASKKMEDAANKQLLASTQMSGGQIAQQLRGAFGLAPAAAGAGVAATVATTLAVIASGAVIGTVVYDILAKQFGLTRVNQIATGGAYKAGQGIGQVAQQFGMSPEEAERKSIVFAAIIGKLSGAIDKNSPLWINAANSIKKASEIIQSSVSLSGSQYEDQIVRAYTQMQEDELKSTQEYNRDRKNIVEQANNDLVQAAIRNAKSISAINKSYDNDIRNITGNYMRQSKMAEVAYAKQRADIIQNSSREIQRIEEDSQERLLKMRREHESNMEGFVARRDAFGLKKEVKRYNEQRQEEIANTNKEIGRRRQDLQIRLNDLAQNFAAERAMRAAEYAQALADAKVRRDEQLKLQAEQYKEEQQQIRDNKRKQLAEAQKNFIEEGKQRHNAFVAMVRDLDAALLGEAKRKREYYNLMLQDAEKFLSQYRATLPGGGTTWGNSGAGIISNKGNDRTRDSGGYMTKGLYALAQNSIPEMVMSGKTTRMAESVMGQITQEKLQALFAGGGKSLTINEGNKRFDSRLSMQDRRAIKKDIIDTFKGLVT